jgi:hypothetical protein
MWLILIAVGSLLVLGILVAAVVFYVMGSGGGEE